MAEKFPESLEQKKVLRRIGLLVVLGAAVYLILPQITVLENSFQVLAKMLLWAVGLALLSQVLSYFGSGYLLQKTLAIARQNVSLMLSTLIVLGAASVSMVAGGTIGSSTAIYRWTSGKEGSIEGATLASLLPSLFNDMVLVILSIVGLVYLLLAHNLTEIQVIGFSITLVVLGLLFGVAILAMRYQDRTTGVINWISALLARFRKKAYDPDLTRKEVDNLFTAWEALWHKGWHLLALGAFLNVFFDMFTLYFLFVASGHVVTIGVLITGYALPILLGKMAFILPGGLGVVETSMTALFSSLGIPSHIAVVAVLGYRLISFWIPSISGFPIAGYLQSRRAKSAKT